MRKVASSTIIYPNVEIEDDVTVEDFCVIGSPDDHDNELQPLVIRSGSHIRSHTKIYSGSRLGSGISTGHHVVIRTKSVIGEGVSIGSYSSIEEEAVIGAFTRLHSYVHIGRGSKVGKFCWLYSLITLMNDPLPPSHIFRPVTVGDMVTIAVNAQVMPGVTIASGAFVTASSLVASDVPTGMVMSGSPAMKIGKVKHLVNVEHGICHPWSNHFLQYYPESLHAEIRNLASKIYN